MALPLRYVMQSEQTNDIAAVVYIDANGCLLPQQAEHGHIITADRCCPAPL